MFRLLREQSTLSTVVMRMSFKVHSRCEPLGRSKSLFGLFHYVLLHKVTNEGRRGVLRGSSSDDFSRDYDRITDITFRDLELSYSERRMLGIRCKKLSYRYPTVGDA